MAGKQKYELLADHYHETTSKPGEPFTYKSYVKGDTIELDAEQAERLLAADAVRKSGEKAPAASRRGAQTKAPSGKADGVGDGDNEPGSIGDGGPDPVGTGSTAAAGVTAGPADGQGAGDAGPSQGKGKSA